MALNPNDELKKIKQAEDKIADSITGFAGTMQFVYMHTVWFGLWIVLNLGLLGAGFVFDAYPFGLLTMVVSLEAIFLSTFVMISQNRQGKAAEHRAELDFQTDVKAEQEIDIIMRTLHRIAEKQGVKIDDLLGDLTEARKLPGLVKAPRRK